MEAIVVGQRWINEAELSLGLGTLVGMDERTYRIDFGAIEEVRTYARQSAALSRARFEVGDRLRNREAVEITVAELVEAEGLITYRGHTAEGEEREFHEMELSDYTQLNRANQRLFTGQVDKPQLYQLRQMARRLADEISHSTTRGLTSGRTSLIPHQLYIAHEVGQRQAPRVLLADEVGLGKTIEAGLIINSQLIAGGVSRVLILVPDHLVNQWLVEMLRRFNLRFSVFDRARLEADTLEADMEEELFGDPAAEENPFESAQLVLCGLSLFTYEKHREQLLATDWDMLVVDEAHHLEWSPEHASEDYLLVDQLARQTASVLLLTATPEQLGKEGHFARLRLLDPARFYDYQSYLQEEQGYVRIAEVVDLLDADLNTLSKQQWAQIEQEMDGDLADQYQALRASLADSDDSEVERLRQLLVSGLLDRHGTGRLLFRNTRAAIQGFPERELVVHPLEADDYREEIQEWAENWRAQLRPETLFADQKKWLDADPRVAWLLDFLKDNRQEKILVIAARAETALDLAEVLRVQTGIVASVFHEGMSIVERDRAAAFFADREYGSPCLICSEIGSEGRNFQFAHQMVLFDLPDNPDLLEQRIGRLDRIGQTQTIRIHVPYLVASAQETLLNFYHQTLDAFEHTSTAAMKIIQQLGGEFEQGMAVADIPASTLKRAAELRRQLEDEMHRGRDHLLERNSCRMDLASELVALCEKTDASPTLAQFMQSFSDSAGVHYEQQTNGTVIMRPTEAMSAALDGLPDEGLTLTYDRDIALSNEDLQFFTWDHPLVQAALDRVLSGEQGNSTVVTMKVAGVRPGSLMLETVFVLDPPNNRELQASRYLPSSRIRVLLDQSGRELGAVDEALIDNKQQPVKRQIAAQISKTKRADLQELLHRASDVAEKAVESIRAEAEAAASEHLDQEIGRLQSLQAVNPNVRDDEIDALRVQRDGVVHSLQQMEVALDAIRVVIFT